MSAYYSASVAAFLLDDDDRVLGALARGHGLTLEPLQKQAWLQQISILRTSLRGVDGYLYLEFQVPRLGTRVDAVLLAAGAVFPIEFKCGEKTYRQADRYQAWDYALDLKNFHSASHKAPIYPVLVATDAPRSDATWGPPHEDGVRPPRNSSAADLGRILRDGLIATSGEPIDGEAWGVAAYRPTPTIIEAARALYAKHSVEDIARHDAGAKNLSVTTTAVNNVVEGSKRFRHKSLVFVTGVPGAGKTLIGLNVATSRRDLGDTHAVFLSGNGPLVAVLREALTRDEMSRRKGVRKGIVLQEVKPFIQNVHHFRDEGLRDMAAPPDDHVVIFDEAQRAWNREQTSNFMKRRKGIHDFDKSEPAFLLSYMDRRADWATVICLVGGGQEINIGEAGIVEWLDAVEAFPDWKIYVSPNLSGSEYGASSRLESLGQARELHFDDRLHLSTSMRSFRSENVSAFVKAVLDAEVAEARKLLGSISRNYPIVITRDLSTAKKWLRDRARGTERYGLVASSGAQRLKPHAIDVRVDIDPIHWFLNDREDTRSSFYLEDAATEFQVQGLELDWVCVTWDADLRRHATDWGYHSFRGDAWTNVRNDHRKRYLLNAYRVLLTRARQGMVIFVPPGDESDRTRAPKFYDTTFEYLRALGLSEV